MRDLLHSEDGNALVEVALALPLIAVLLAGTIDYGVYAERKMQATEAANAGASYGTVPGNQLDNSRMQSTARTASPTLSGLSATATHFYSCTSGGAKVTSSYSCSGRVNPIIYVQVSTSATVTSPVYFSGVATSAAINGQAIYRVPWKSDGT